jgi:hypothetical protein
VEEAVPKFKLNSGASIPAVGLGTWQADPGLVGKAVKEAIKVKSSNFRGQCGIYFVTNDNHASCNSFQFERQRRGSVHDRHWIGVSHSVEGGFDVDRRLCTSLNVVPLGFLLSSCKLFAESFSHCCPDRVSPHRLC